MLLLAGSSARIGGPLSMMSSALLSIRMWELGLDEMGELFLRMHRWSQDATDRFLKTDLVSAEPKAGCSFGSWSDSRYMC